MTNKEKLALWAAWMELNEIRARDGVPRNSEGHKVGVSEEYFSDVVDLLDNILKDHNIDVPWVPKDLREVHTSTFVGGDTADHETD